MISQSTTGGRATTERTVGTIDVETADRLDLRLERALRADDANTKDVHVRHARQLLEVPRID
jgi:hypothetical protein